MYTPRGRDGIYVVLWVDCVCWTAPPGRPTPPRHLMGSPRFGHGGVVGTWPGILTADSTGACAQYKL